MSQHAEGEYLKAMHSRYRHANRAMKHLLLTEGGSITGYHRKYAIRRLNGLPLRRRLSRSAVSVGRLTGRPCRPS